MTYQVLARKWRPRNFSQLVGQEHVSQSLIHALQHQRLHHAYLFTGTRGVGKTTVARILAKAINCENLKDFNPCGECAVCVDFDQGRFMDLIEVDAASRTKVEDTRDLLDNAQYAPNQGRYKVYLIDEVHMLSGHSFNALLKTLEEPPEHVKFLLATTDPHKIPVTVLSRCLQFNLKRLTPSQIETQMRFILGEEQMSFEDGALKLLARAADGSMRDGLSLLDQAIAFSGGTLAVNDVANMLGTVAQHPVENLLTALAAFDGNALLQHVADMSQLSPDFGDVLQAMLRLLHRVALMQQLPNFVDEEFDTEFLAGLARTLSREEVQLFYQIALMGQKDLELAPEPRSGFEMVLLRMLAFKPKTVADAVTGAQSPAIPNSKLPGATVAPQQPATASIRPKEAVMQTPVAENAAAATSASKPEDWGAMIVTMKLTALTRQLANHCVLDRVDEQQCCLRVDSGYAYMPNTRAEENLQKALQTYFGKPLKLVITQQQVSEMTPAYQIKQNLEARQQAAVDAVNADETVHALQTLCNARIVPGSIAPIHEINKESELKNT